MSTSLLSTRQCILCIVVVCCCARALGFAPHHRTTRPTTSLWVSTQLPRSQRTAPSSESSSSLQRRRRTAVPPYTDPQQQIPVNRQIEGDWEEIHGNYVLRPSVQKPRAIVHFLGGAIVGAVPQVTYRHMLEQLAAQGFLVVATPFNLSFDHVATCEEVLQKYESLQPLLHNEYGHDLPVVGIGHSCGALLQLLITTLFPHRHPRVANALMSFNNKQFADAVPIPIITMEKRAPERQWLATAAMRHHRKALEAHMYFLQNWSPSKELRHQARKRGKALKQEARELTALPPSSNTERFSLSLQLLRAASNGELPSDQVLAKVLSLDPFLPRSITENAHIPSQVRQAYRQFFFPTTQALSGAGVLPLLRQCVDTLDQLPGLMEEVGDGARDFHPSPQFVKTAARRAYRAERTLIVKFETDGIDESDDIEHVLRTCHYPRDTESSVPFSDQTQGLQVERTTLPGGHSTPLAQATDTVNTLVQWLEDGNL